MSYPFKTVFAFVIFLRVCAVYADPQDMVDPDYAAELVSTGKIVSLDQLLAMNQVLTRGRMLDLELEQNDDVFTYEVEVLHTDGHVSEYEFDAVTGKLLQESFGE